MYYPQGSVLVGNFVNGRANGPVHYFWPDGSYFQGVVENNVGNDSDATFHCSDYTYKGSIRNNCFDGMGTLVGRNDLYTYVGEFKNGRKTDGKLSWKQAENTTLPLSSSQVQYMADYSYTGKFDENENFTGQGVLVTPKGKYTGQF